MSKLKIYSWNVNGIRAALKKGFEDFIKEHNPDIICLQETKAKQGQVEVDFEDYEEYWNSAERAGYAGTAIFTKHKPISVKFGIEIDGKIPEVGDNFGGLGFNEGRVTTAEFEDFYLVTVYTPNSKRGLERLGYREKVWDPMFRKYLKFLEKTKPVLACGDLNVAHKEIDLARPKDNTKNAGFTDEERKGFDELVKDGFVDTFRMFNQEPDNYTWWSYFAKSRERNIGWRIDYFVVSESIKDRVTTANIHPDVFGSDHCPVSVEFKI